MSLIKPNIEDKTDSIVPEVEVEKYRELLSLESPIYDFEIVPGFFKQSSLDTDDTTYDSLNDHLGLNKPSWENLLLELQKLNSNSPADTKYKLIFCARHGQGYHNYTLSIVGRPLWDSFYSHQYGDVKLPNGEVVNYGPDPFLTPLGESQAKFINETLIKEINNGMPLPTKLFSSPFTRSCQTLYYSMNNILMFKNSDKGLKPLIMENLRETIGEHTCDERSSKKVIEERLNGWGFTFEDGFTENDELYRSDWRESVGELTIRSNRFLQNVFDDKYNDDLVVYSSSHSGQVKSILLAVGHRPYIIPTAGLIPIVVKAVKRK